ncbi:MFS transporter [bacterium]|nr:MFS transporter [bacterium]
MTTETPGAGAAGLSAGPGAGAASAGTAPAADQQRASPYAWLVLAVLLFIYIFNFLDRQLMSILQEPIKEELGLTDGQLGLMTGLYFALVYTVLGVVVGFLADRTSRRNILFAGAFLWSLFTVFCGLAKTYPTMVAARMGVGVGEAAGAPPSYSIISDYFPPRMRGTALAIFSLGVPFGMALGAAFGAKIHEIWGWRMAFIGIGAAGIAASFLLLFIVREPKRGAMDPPEKALQAQEKSGFVETTRDFFANPVLLLTALGCGAAAFVGYALLNWNVSFLIRVKGITYGDIATYYALMLAVSIGGGTIVAGVLVDWLVKRSKVWYAMLPAIAFTLSIPFHLAYVWAPTWEMSLLLAAGPSFLNICYLAPALAVVQNTVKPSQRTMAGALLLLVNNLIGLGLGPAYVGWLSDGFAAGLGPVEGLRMAMYWVTPAYAVTVAFLLAEAWALKRQERQAGGSAG